MTDELIDQVVFTEPPPMRVQKYDWAAIAKRLKRKPGVWAKVYDEDKAGFAVAIRSNSVRALKREHGFESRTANNRKTDSGRTCALWLRYNPEADTRKTNQKEK